ncbi:hypothetical protein [Halovivax limisalsi]|uniref:hypothetical protein n=1 Tax=Halovivax limisalsi TaxID=1453760 RepID=UPI001FFD8B90|nr:hypothetical protein [Halovivax limisalsi]
MSRSDVDDGTGEKRPARRSVLRSIGATGAAVTGTAAAGSVAAAPDEPTAFIKTNATQSRARRAFRSERGRKLLEQLADRGHIESAEFDALRVDRVTAEQTTGLDVLTTVEAQHKEHGRVAGFVAKLESDRFDGPITVRLFPEAGIAGAVADRGGERLVLSPEYDGWTRKADAEPMDCNGCSGWTERCGSNDCDCGRYCSDYDDMNSKYLAHKTCSDGTVYCDSHECWLCCTCSNW